MVAVSDHVEKLIDREKDKELKEIGYKILQSERLSFDEGVLLF